MKKGLVELVGILDASGSMEGERIKDARDGFNKILAEQSSVPGECVVTIVTFNSNPSVIATGVPIDKAPKLTEHNYYAQGLTALLDAIGHTINIVGRRWSGIPDDKCPEQVIVVIATDGEENSSREFTHTRIKDMIKHQEDKYNWKFIYLGADARSVTEAQSLGMMNAAQYDANSHLSRGVMYQTVSAVTKAIRLGDEDVNVQDAYNTAMQNQPTT